MKIKLKLKKTSQLKIYKIRTIHEMVEKIKKYDIKLLSL